MPVKAPRKDVRALPPPFRTRDAIGASRSITHHGHSCRSYTPSRLCGDLSGVDEVVTSRGSSEVKVISRPVRTPRMLGDTLAPISLKPLGGHEACRTRNDGHLERPGSGGHHLAVRPKPSTAQGGVGFFFLASRARAPLISPSPTPGRSERCACGMFRIGRGRAIVWLVGGESIGLRRDSRRRSRAWSRRLTLDVVPPVPARCRSPSGSLLAAKSVRGVELVAERSRSRRTLRSLLRSSPPSIPSSTSTDRAQSDSVVGDFSLTRTLLVRSRLSESSTRTALWRARASEHSPCGAGGRAVLTSSPRSERDPVRSGAMTMSKGAVYRNGDPDDLCPSSSLPAGPPVTPCRSRISWDRAPRSNPAALGGRDVGVLVVGAISAPRPSASIPARGPRRQGIACRLEDTRSEGPPSNRSSGGTSGWPRQIVTAGVNGCFGGCSACPRVFAHRSNNAAGRSTRPAKGASPAR